MFCERKMVCFNNWNYFLFPLFLMKHVRIVHETVAPLIKLLQNITT